MNRTMRAAPLPAGVKAAAGLLVVSGLTDLLNATAMHRAGGWAASSLVPWAALFLVGCGLIAGGLLRRAWWAWWVAVAYGALRWLAGVMAVLVVERGDVYWLPPSGYQSLIVVSLAALGAAVTLLLSPSARKAFRGAVA